MNSDDTRTVIDYEKASVDLRRYLPLKLATLAWILAVFALALYAIAATWAEWWPYPQLDIPNLTEAKPAVYSFFAGMLGASAYCLRGFYWAVGPQQPKVRRYQYDPNFTFWYLSRPILGAVLGAALFAVLRAGVGTLGTASTSSAASATYFAVGFLGGYSVTEVMTWLYKTALRVFGIKEDGQVDQRSAAEDE